MLLPKRARERAIETSEQKLYTSSILTLNSLVYWPHTQTLRSWLYVLYSDKALPLQEVTFKLVQFLDFRCTSDLFDNEYF